jgi:signal transduction histidine kinase/ActR/RegA family two-component response regulator
MIKRLKVAFDGRSILFQVLAPALALVVLSFVAVGAVTAWSRAAGASDMFRNKVELSASLSQDSVSTALWLLDEAALQSALSPLAADPDTRLVWIRDEKGETHFLEGDARLKAEALEAMGTVGGRPEAQTAREGRNLFSVVPLFHAEDGRVRPLGHLVVVYDTRSVAHAMWGTIAWVVGVGAAAIAMTVALLVLLMRRITRPLNCLSASMASLSAGELETSIHNTDRRDEVGAMARSVQVFKDNALRLLEAERESARLLEERTRAEAASEAKSEFLAHMSHELRTPLNGVLTMAQLLSREPLTSEQREKLEIILMSGQDLLHVINDVLDFSKIEAGRLELEQVAFRPDEVLQGVRSSFDAVADRKGLSLSLEVAPDARGPRLGDPARVRQIVSNFVANALKFTAEGGVSIRLELEGDGLRISVADTGIGIPTESMDALFQKFTQVDASTTRKYGGTGLGLAICRELAEHMGGRAWAESVAGEGSTFFVFLPLPMADETAETTAVVEEPSARPDRPLRVLAAEDNRTNQIVLKSIMDVFGVDLTLAGDGREAVEAWSRSEFDLILMDVQMPEVDGPEATRRIRRAEAETGRRPVRIIALTANAFRHQVDEYVAAGMNGHLAKPIDVAALRAVLEQACEALDAPQSRSAAAA